MCNEMHWKDSVMCCDMVWRASMRVTYLVCHSMTSCQVAVVSKVASNGFEWHIFSRHSKYGDQSEDHSIWTPISQLY